jgi:hypothetical protein
MGVQFFMAKAHNTLLYAGLHAAVKIAVSGLPTA